MNLKVCRRLINLLYLFALVLAVASFFLADRILQMGVLGVALAACLMVALLRLKFWRCPQCGHALSKGGRIRCTNCDWELPD